MSRDVAMKAALWIIPVVFGAGGFYALMVSSSSQLSTEVAEVHTELADHVQLKGHPVTEERLETIVTEQRAVRVEQIEQGENIAAICQATGARCR